MVQAQPPAQQNETAFQPPMPSPLVMEDYAGIFTSTSRVGVDDKQMWWCDGFFPIGKNLLRTLPGVGNVVFTRPSTFNIAFFDFANIGSTPIAIVVMADGGVYQLNTLTNTPVQIAPSGTILNPSRENVGISQYGSQYVIIVARQTNGYFIWDGSSFYGPGAAFPAGGNLPTAIGGTAVETYAGRVWIANGATITFSAPGSVVDFSSGGGGGNFTSSDPFLRVSYIQLKQTNGFLYLIGDSSINYISGVQTSGSPPITTFTNQNADPEVGTPYPASVTTFGRNILFANAFGCHVSYGAAVTKISDALDGFYTSVPNFGGAQLSSAKAIIYGKKVWMVLAPVIDQFTGQQRIKLMIWNGNVWFTSEQDVPLTYIQHQEINSVITAWGTDGITLRPLFQLPSNAFAKTVMSKLWPTPIGYNNLKTATRFWGIAQYYSLVSPDVELLVDCENASESSSYTLTPTATNSLMNWATGGGLPMNWTTEFGDPMIWSAISTGIVVWEPTGIGQTGVLLGFTLRTNSQDMAHISAMISPAIVGYRG